METTRNFQNLQQDIEIPVKNRKQTDFVFFIALVLVYLFLVISVSIAGSEGDLRRLFHGYDDKGNLCGFENEPILRISGSGLNLVEEKYLDVSETCNREVCWEVKKCIKDCRYGNYRYCSTYPYNNRSSQLHSFVKNISHDLTFYWKEILAMCFFSICLSAFMMTALRIFPSFVICFVFLIVSIAAIGGTIYIWTVFAEIQKESWNSKEENLKKTARIWFMISATVTLLMVVFLYSLCSVKEKYKVISILFKKGGKCIRDMPALLLQPVLTYLIDGIFVCFVFIGLACFITSGKAVLDENGIVHFPVSIIFQITSWLLLFAFLWLNLFLVDCQNLVIAGAVSSWCFSKIKESNRVYRSFFMVLKYHLGSAAFGSLLIAIVRAIRLLINMCKNKENRGGLARVLAAIGKCLLLCMESLLQILNKAAYVMIVLFGEPFCISARKAFICITEDASNAGIVIGIGSFILTIVELLISLIVSFVGFAIFKTMDVDADFWIPTITVFFLSCICCHCFFSVYDMTMDTLIICYCVDLQMGLGLENPFNTLVLSKVRDEITNEMPNDRDVNRTDV